MLVDQLKADRMTAMKERNAVAKTILTTLLGELEGAAKRGNSDITDDMVIRTCKKFVAANLEVIAFNGNNVEQLAEENIVLDRFIPKQLTKDELYAIIEGLEADNLGTVMKHLKANHDGTYDGKLAANVAHTVLSR